MTDCKVVTNMLSLSSIGMKPNLANLLKLIMILRLWQRVHSYIMTCDKVVSILVTWCEDFLVF